MQETASKTSKKIIQDSLRCTLCPRACMVDRIKRVGICGASRVIRIGRAALHWWEEPPLVGSQGSGAIFFSYCPLRCVYCQNKELAAGSGIEVTPEEFRALVLRLQNEEHAANINLVTPTHYTDRIAPVLRSLKESGELVIPVVYNTSGYESEESLAYMEGIVDIYLTDYKYARPDVAQTLSAAPDYPCIARSALDRMHEQVGDPAFDNHGLMTKGVIVRHLVLPGYLDNSYAVLDELKSYADGRVLFSIMNQFTSLLSREELARYGLDSKVDDHEYDALLDYADELGFGDYFWQEGGACEESFIPLFDGTGVKPTAKTKD